MLGAHGDGVTVTTDAGVLVAAVLAGCLAFEHLAVLGDAMTLALGNAVLAVERLALGGCPSKVVTADLNVVVGELAKLVVVHTQKLSLLRGTQVHAGNLVDDERKESADGERVCGAGGNVGDLLVDSRRGTGDGTGGKTVVDAIEADDVVRAEDTVEEETDHSSDTVLSEHVEGIVNADPELDCELLENASNRNMTSNVLLVAKLATIPVVIPRTTDAQGVMKPEAGVAATRPEMTPEHQPTMDHLRARRQSRRTQVIAANMAVRLEFQQAMVARRLAPNADPPLKPNHPNHRKTVPRVIRETL